MKILILLVYISSAFNEIEGPVEHRTVDSVEQAAVICWQAENERARLSLPETILARKVFRLLEADIDSGSVTDVRIPRVRFASDQDEPCKQDGGFR